MPAPPRPTRRLPAAVHETNLPAPAVIPRAPVAKSTDRLDAILGSEKSGPSHEHPLKQQLFIPPLAEGFGKRSQAEKFRFLNIAESSLEECRYYLILTQDLGFGETGPLMLTLEETSRLLNAYARAILASGS